MFLGVCFNCELFIAEREIFIAENLGSVQQKTWIFLAFYCRSIVLQIEHLPERFAHGRRCSFQQVFSSNGCLQQELSSNRCLRRLIFNFFQVLKLAGILFQGILPVSGDFSSKQKKSKFINRIVCIYNENQYHEKKYIKVQKSKK